jgi:hypothetical protein
MKRWGGWCPRIGRAVGSEIEVSLVRFEPFA